MTKEALNSRSQADSSSQNRLGLDPAHRLAALADVAVSLVICVAEFIVDYHGEMGSSIEQRAADLTVMQTIQAKP
ncbi:MAG: hypothetical protein H0X45_15425 [Planctomycetes bacterium]|nr:hypothetical protein [Planctomycetota bacterium]